MNDELYRKLRDLTRMWNRRARKAFKDAESESDEIGRRLIEHGAMCYFNCAQDLSEAIIEAVNSNDLVDLVAGDKQNAK